MTKIARETTPAVHKYYQRSDGQGNYVLNNDYSAKPGSNFEEIQAAE